jgi:hypothetical protein
VPPKPLPFETLHEGSAIRFLGSVYATARVATAVRRLLPRVLHLYPFIISNDMTKEVGQGSAPCSFGLISKISSHPAVFFSHNKPANSAFSTINQRNEQAAESLERMGGYDWFISLLFYVFRIMLVSVVYPCCFKRCYESISFVQLYRFCLYSVSVSAIRYMSCLLVSLVQSSCFIHCCLYVSVVLLCRFTCCHMFIAVVRYMFCLTIMLHISCFHVLNNHMLHMIIDHMFYIVMDMFDIKISMVNNLLYVIIITLICEIKMTWKLPNILTFPWVFSAVDQQAAMTCMLLATCPCNRSG